MLHDILGDVRTSLRQLGRTPGFTAAAIAVLALGIALNAAVFGVVHALVFAGRAFAEPDQVVQIYSRHTQEVDSYRAFSHGAFEVLAARRDVFTGVTAHTLGTVGVRETTGGDARRTFAGFVAASFFDVLGVPVVQGRPFTADEGRPGAGATVAIATNAYWQRTGRRADLVGSTVLVNERPVTIVGITPPGFTGTMMVIGPELLLPLGAFDLLRTESFADDTRALAAPDTFPLYLVGRLAPGVTPAAASTRLAPADAALADAFPAQYRGRALSVAPLPRFGTSTNPMDERVLSTLAIVFLGLTSAVLLIVCLNLASVLVARGEARRREFAIRLALGGGRARIIRQLLVEALLIGGAAAVGGVLVAVPAIDAFLGTLLARLPISLSIDAGTSGAATAAAFGFGVVASVLFALGPALIHSRDRQFGDLKHQLGDTAPTKRRWVRSPLVAAQVALSLALLVAAGLFVRLARDGTAVDAAMAAEATVIADLDGALAGLDEARALPIYAALESELAALPGVETAAIGVTVPFGGVNLGYEVRRAGTRPAPGDRPATPAEGRAFEAKWNAVGSGYPRAMGLTLRRGRTFTEAEAQRAGAPRVAIIDDILARQLWPDGDAIGQSIHIGSELSAADGGVPVAVQVVGIVSPQITNVFPTEQEGTVLVPFAQGYRSGVHLHVRPRAGGDADLVRDVRRVIQATAPGVPVFGVTTFGAHLASSIEFWGLRTLATAMSGIGLFAAFIAVVGVYGAKSYAVARRSREIGVRLAVGASPARVRAQILGEALWIGGVGVAVGALLGLGIGQALDAVFVDMVPFDAAVFTVTPLALLAACAAAAWLPARRASRLDPAQVLRSE
ncbi:MAG: ABC transporter permease [Acidobacteria bacterium]|nr:ABC transporter permease [Acidobacteriota bacterium]